MLQIGDTVIQTTTGKDGQIVQIDDTYVYIDFGHKKHVKFSRNAFIGGKFLQYKDPVIQQQVHNIVYNEFIAAKQATPTTPQSSQPATKPAQSKAYSYKPIINSNNIATLGPNYNYKLLNLSSKMTYKDVENLHNFKIYPRGKGINYNKMNCVVLISSITRDKKKFVYHDRWNFNNEYEYSGEGKSGDQKMTGGNKAICDVAQNGKPIYLYIKFGPQEYYPQGEVKLVTYKTVQSKGADGKMRSEFIFIFKS